MDEGKSDGESKDDAENEVTVKAKIKAQMRSRMWMILKVRGSTVGAPFLDDIRS